MKGKNMEELFKKLEELCKSADEIENDLHNLTGYYFPTPNILYMLADNKKITQTNFAKAFKLMIYYRLVSAEKNAIIAELEEIEKELKQ